MSVTLSEIRLRSRQKADRENSNFVENEELDFMINSSIAELHDLLIAHAGADYYLNSVQGTTVAGTSTYALPTDFYKLKGVDIKVAGEWRSIRPFNFNERNRLNESELYWASSTRYRLHGDNILLNPVPDTALEYQLWYTPLAQKLVADTDILKDLNQYVEYVLVDVAIKYLNKEESDVQVLMAQKVDLRKRIENMSANRDEGQPESVSDIYAENNNYWYRGF
jgi:hypothetical protein